MTPRILVAGVSLDGDDRGVKFVARILRDAGFEVVFGGSFETPDAIAATAVDEDVDAIALSMLSGDHLTLAPMVAAELHQRGGDIPVVVAGRVSERDLDQLRERGVAAILSPDAAAAEIVRAIGRVLAGWAR